MVSITRDESQTRIGQASNPRSSVGLNYWELLLVILADPVLKNAFHAHLCEENGVEPLTFLDAVERWKTRYPTSTKDVSYARAKKIIKNYVGNRAPFSIPLSNAQVDNLIRKTARPENLTIDSFEGARMEMMKQLQFGPLIRFTRTHIWKGFVEDGLIGDDLRISRRTTRNSSLLDSPGTIKLSPKINH